jgi:lambda repressor-like predicted transcriptional regulator
MKGKIEKANFSKRNIFTPHMRLWGIETMQQLSKITGINKSSLCSYAVVHSLPALYKALDIAQALHTTVEELWGTENQKEAAR